jgi:predicted DNA-binding protein (UPF0251 family)
VKHKRVQRTANGKNRHRQSKPRSNACITTIEQFFALPQRTQEIVLALPEAVSLMRSNDISARAAARAAGISRSTLIRRGGSALQKLDNGRYAAKRNVRKTVAKLQVWHNRDFARQ